MIFENKDAESLFIEFNKKYGLNHISSVEPITIRDLHELEESLIKAKSKM